MDLTAIEQRASAYGASHDHPNAFACCTAHGSADDVPALVARVRELEGERDGLLTVLREVKNTLNRRHHPYGTAHAHNCMHAVAELRRLLNMPTHEEI